MNRRNLIKGIFGTAAGAAGVAVAGHASAVVQRETSSSAFTFRILEGGSETHTTTAGWINAGETHTFSVPSRSRYHGLWTIKDGEWTRWASAGDRGSITVPAEPFPREYRFDTVTRFPDSP